MTSKNERKKKKERKKAKVVNSLIKQAISEPLSIIRMLLEIFIALTIICDGNMSKKY